MNLEMHSAVDAVWNNACKYSRIMNVYICVLDSGLLLNSFDINGINRLKATYIEHKSIQICNLNYVN